MRPASPSMASSISELATMPGLSLTMGLHLDGQRAFAPANRLGEAAVGPMGMLEVLETRLGLLAERPARVERVVQYLGCLRRADSPSRFYHRSLIVDPLGTAAALLDWRDRWLLEGWSGRFAPGAPARLADMADVEALARGAVSPGAGERLVDVAQALRRRSAGITVVTSVDPLDAFPARWRDVLQELPLQFAALPVEPQGRGFLGVLQHAIGAAAKGTVGPRTPWVDDGTVVVVRAETLLAAGRWSVARLRCATDVLLVAPVRAGTLEAAYRAAAEPLQGLGGPSALRPAMQLLRLALELCWEPLDFHALVQFLSHPVCPVPAYARQRLARKLADRPGVGGAEWERVIAGIDAHYGVERASDARAAIAFWVECPRFRPDAGAPIPELRERVAALRSYFASWPGRADAPLRAGAAAGHAQCESMLRALDAMLAQGETAIAPAQLQALLELAAGPGGPNPLAVAECGAQRAVCHPGAAVNPAQTVLWWQLSAPRLPRPLPWSASELQALAASGARLPASADEIARCASQWIRPVLAARGSLVLVLPPATEEVHPLWQIIDALFEKPALKDVEALLREPAAFTGPVAHAPLPARRRWWRLPADVAIAPRPLESFSSLERLLFNPSHWLLEYGARLRGPSVAPVADDFRVQGNIAHRLLEQWFRRDDALAAPAAAMEHWFAANFPRIVSEEGATLLATGKGGELASCRWRLLRAANALRQHLSGAGARMARPEVELAASWPPGDIAGSADLVVQGDHGRFAIVDMKWAGARKRREALQANGQLQLAVYAAMLQQCHGAFPAVAYFVLRDALMLAPDATFFRAAEFVRSRDREDSVQLWERALVHWEWRRGQVAAGLFELGFEDIEPTDASEPPADALTAFVMNPAYNEYRHLAGWRA